jgi:hypothetical protein
MAKHDTRKTRPHGGAVQIGDIPEFKALGERIGRQAERSGDEQEALAAFQRQREQEQAVSKPPRPAEPPFEPTARVKSWGETVRPWTSHGSGTGVQHVTTTSPDMVGVRFDRGKERTPEEKREMEAAGLKFFTAAQAWLKPNRDGAFDETQELARKFAERRRSEDGWERGR